MSRKPIVAGNWKMHGTRAEAKALAQAVVQGLGKEQSREVALCPPHVHLEIVGQTLQGSAVRLGAQNAYWETQGAFTGVTSPAMLKDVGCHYVILGHSERRHVMGECNADIQRKVTSALAADLDVILCVGETLEERKQNHTLAVVENQLSAGLKEVEASRVVGDIVIAYEPVWAIGTGVNATPEQAQEVHAAIRTWLSKRFGAAQAEGTRIQYGGSVKPANAGELLSQPDVDGALVGGASLKPEDFIAIVQAAESVPGTSVPGARG